MKLQEPGWGRQQADTSGRASVAVTQGSRHPVLLLALLGLLRLPAAGGDCGPPPHVTHAKPSGVNLTGSFPVGSKVTYTCLEGTIKLPGRSNTVECLPGPRWSELSELCGRSCASPTRLQFAALSEKDQWRNFYPVGITVSYFCRPGYENITESFPTSTCLQNLTWSQAPELCKRKSCGRPGTLPRGRALPPTDFLFGARVALFCEDGYKLSGRHFIQCQLKGDNVEWSKFPTCELITCSPPPKIINGKHDGEGVEQFAYNSTVTYNCDPGFQLSGNVSIRCTSTDKINGVWSGAAPECKEKRTSVKLKSKEMEKSRALKDSYGYSIQASKKAFKKEMKISLYKKSLQNTISFSRSSSFSRALGNCVTSAFRFVVPLYKSQSYYYAGSSQRSVCSPKYMGISGILPQGDCFENLKRSKVPALCGTRSWAARRTRTWQKCCYSRFPIRCKGIFYP
ncbi:complement decay-accelerating factor-like isoform X2 [Rhea pennata]|uniref:complement decay-accelerating factor-like isoform X2 n=1 Tax=Rhea pennata TaxID=8795 RepID=UPI002E262991